MDQRRSLAALAALVCAGLVLWLALTDRSGRVPHGEPGADPVRSIGPTQESGTAALPPAAGDAPAEAQRLPAAEAPAQTPLLVVEGVVLLAPTGAVGAPTPVAGARIEVGPNAPPEVFVAGEDGRFRVELWDRGHRPVSLLLTAGRQTEFVPWAGRIDFMDGESRVEGLRCVLSRASGLEAVCLDPGGAPLPGVAVSFEGGKPVRTDAAGRFEFQDIPKDRLNRPIALEGDIAAELDGWQAVDVDIPGFDAEGRWIPARITMVGTTRLEVNVRSRGAGGRPGSPAEGVKVSLAVADCERLGGRDRAGIGFRPRTSAAQTDAAGRATLQDVPAGLRLRVRVDGRDHHVLRPASGEGAAGLLVTDRDARSADVALVLGSGEFHAVEVVTGRALQLSGRVLEADGRPAKGAELRIRARAAEDSYGKVRVMPRAIRADEDGRFTATCRLPNGADALVVQAWSREGEEPALSPFGGPRYPDPLMAASVEIALDGLAERAELDIRLRPRGTVAGIVLDAQGEPVLGARVECCDPATGERIRDGLALDAMAHTGGDGRFRVLRLPPGPHVLRATSGQHGTVERSGVVPGMADLELRFGEPRRAHFEVVVKAERPLGAVSIARGRLEPTSASPEPLRRLGAREAFSLPIGSPPGADGIWNGSTGVGAAGFTGRLNVVSGSGDADRFSSIAGVHWIGARGQDADGRALFPMGTGAVVAGQGEHRVELRLACAAQLRGRVEGAGAGAALLRVRLSSGEVVACYGPKGDRAEHFRLASDRTFELSLVPAVPLLVEVGTWQELERGAPRDVVQIHPEPEGIAEVTLTLR